MALFFESWLLDIFIFVTTLITILISAIKWSHHYWQRKGVLTLPPTLFGNVFLNQEEFAGDVGARLYNYFRKHDQPHGGFYMLFMPMYMPVDPEIIKCVMQNDFSHFVDHGVFYNEETDPLSAHLFSLEGTKWRDLRAKLSPTFTSGKMKMMFETLSKCGDQLITEMDKLVAKDPVDIKDILGRFTTDVIGNCAFGINCNTLKNPNTELVKYLKLTFKHNFWENIVGLCSFMVPSVVRKLGLRIMNPDLADYFYRMIQDIVDYREKNNVYRKDFMHLLLQLKNRGKVVDDGNIFGAKDDKEGTGSLSMDELAAQAFVFFIAGYETSATTMTFCLFELALNEDIQNNLREEVMEVLKKHDNKLTYDAITEMRYMDKVINETLRKYPPLSGLNRVCTKDYRVPGTDVIIEKGTKVLIPVYSLQRDPEYYPDPERFDPERFSEENKKARHPYTFLPFGEGPRICIGLRFGLMQTKIGLSVLLKNYKFSLSSKTVLPLQMDPQSFVTTTKTGIWLDFVKV